MQALAQQQGQEQQQRGKEGEEDRMEAQEALGRSMQLASLRGPTVAAVSSQIAREQEESKLLMDQLEHLKRESNTAKQGEMRARRREQVLQEREHKAKAGSAGLLRKESSAATQAVKQLLQERGNKRKTRKTGSAGSLEQEQQHKQFATRQIKKNTVAKLLELQQLIEKSEATEHALEISEFILAVIAYDESFLVSHFIGLSTSPC